MPLNAFWHPKWRSLTLWQISGVFRVLLWTHDHVRLIYPNQGGKHCQINMAEFKYPARVLESCWWKSPILHILPWLQIETLKPLTIYPVWSYPLPIHLFTGCCPSCQRPSRTPRAKSFHPFPTCRRLTHSESRLPAGEESPSSPACTPWDVGQSMKKW